MEIVEKRAGEKAPYKHMAGILTVNCSSSAKCSLNRKLGMFGEALSPLVSPLSMWCM